MLSYHKSANKTDFSRETDSISYIALQEGLLPSTLQLICVMNRDKIKYEAFLN